CDNNAPREDLERTTVLNGRNYRPGGRLTVIVDSNPIRRVDPAVYELALREAKKQVEQIRLIPSENYASSAVLEALSTPFANKYSEGYPGENKRYYEGQEFIDQVEQLAIERAKKLF